MFFFSGLLLENRDKMELMEQQTAQARKEKELYEIKSKELQR